MDSEFLRSAAQVLLGRVNLEEAVLAETADRLAALLARVRSLDPARLQALTPAISFDPANPAYAGEPQQGAPVWQPMAEAGAGGSGYGGSAEAQAAKPVGGTPAPPPTSGALALDKSGTGRWSALELAAAIRERRISPVEAVRDTLQRLQATDEPLHAFVWVRAEAALAEAKEAEKQVMRGGPLPPLCGVPTALKDLFHLAGAPTTAGSRVMAGYVAGQDATTTRRLRASGAIVVGKTATHEFAFGATTDSPYHGPVHNPWKPGHSPGGSSGGSGAAVAAGVVPVALGTDTGGSIRIPAAACGIVGLKPTYGRVSKHGVVPLSWSLDHPGPLARTVADAAFLLSVLAGPDPLDPTTLAAPGADWLASARAGAREGLQGTRVGVPADWLAKRVDSEVKAAFTSALRDLESLGAAVIEVLLPPSDVLMLVNRIIALAEAGAYHSPSLNRQAKDYGPDVRARLELGQFVLAQDYLTAQRLRGELSREVARVMAGVDVVVLPTLPIPAPIIGQAVWDYGDARETVPEALIRLTSGFSVTGQPAASVPCGFTRAGLPVGLQIVGRPLDEATVLRVAAAYEAAGSGETFSRLSPWPARWIAEPPVPPSAPPGLRLPSHPG